ncbi:MAG: glutathionylspermidine synthase family protein [Alphaproteobacteria bacterium]
MRRIANTPRPNWQASLRQYPYGAEALPAAASWDESVRYEFSADEIDAIEAVADEVHGMVREAVRQVVETRTHGLLGIKPEAARMIDASWKAYWNGGQPDARQGGLYGRLDFAHDGRDGLKLVGCNYDSPVGLFEAAVVQWNWLEAAFSGADQFNGLHEALADRWREMVVGLRGRDTVHLTCATPDPRREGELAYLAATAEEAEVSTRILPIQDIGWDGSHFVDMDEEAISWLLKLYPWEALLEDQFGQNLKSASMSVLDPAWRIPASNHGLLAVLWELYPEHPNLCPASFREADLGDAGMVIQRSLLGLDRAAERITEGGETVAETEPSANPGGYVYIARPAWWRGAEVRTVLQTWVVGDKCLGMTVREGSDEIFSPEDAAVVPHLFR